MSHRRLSWSAALRDLKDDHLTRQPVREDRLRAAAGLRGAPALALSAWRGRSGRRYVVGVHALAVGLDELEHAVVIAARRGDIGGAVLVGAIALEADPSALTVFLDTARTVGATELHVHRLAITPAERAAIVADLITPPSAD